MISDTLFNAIEEIRSYQENFPGTYSEQDQEQIKAVLGRMLDVAQRISRLPE